MLTFEVNDMTCGHCVRAIKDAVRGLDASARVDVDLGRHIVRVQSDRLDAAGVRDVLARAGYTADETAVPQAASPASGPCCGCAAARCACGG